MDRVERKWIAGNPAKRWRPPKSIKPKPIDPYTSLEIAAILAACDEIGHEAYERLRARAMVLLMRYFALSIADVAAFSRERIRDGLIHLPRHG
jgi:hypothetical protein